MLNEFNASSPTMLALYGLQSHTITKHDTIQFVTSVSVPFHRSPDSVARPRNQYLLFIYTGIRDCQWLRLIGTTFRGK